MRDDFQIPNLGQAPNDYDIGFFNRFAKNIENMMQTVRSKGRGIFADVQTDQLEVTGPVTVTGDTTFTGNQTVTGTLSVGGTSTLHAVNATGTQTITGNETISGTLGVTGATTLTTLATSGAATLASAAITGAGTVGGSVIRTRATSPWELAHESTFTAQSSKEVTGLVGYRELRIIAEIQPDTVADAFAMNFANVAGTYDTTSWGQGLVYNTSTTATATGAWQAGTKAYYDMNWNNVMPIPATIDFPFMFEMHVRNYNKTVHKTYTTWFVSYLNASSAIFQGTDQGYNNQRQACDRVRIKCVSGGNFSGHLIIEGMLG